MNMRLILILLVIFIGASAQTQKLAAQPKFSGTWKGAAFSNTEAVQFIYELELKVIGGLIEGVIKKQNNNNEVSINKILGQKKYLSIEFEEKVIRSKSKTQNIIPPKIYALKYNLKTGYLEAFEDSLSGMKIVFSSTGNFEGDQESTFISDFFIMSKITLKILFCSVISGILLIFSSKLIL